MSRAVDAERIKGWIDDDFVESIERMPDEVAEFNFGVEMSNILIHVVRRRPDGPIIIGQEIEYGNDVRSRIRNLPDSARNDLVARIREVLTNSSVVYGFHDESGNNVRFEDLQRIFVEHRLYPDAMSQQALMTGLVDVWKVVRYLDDVPTLVGSVEG